MKRIFCISSLWTTYISCIYTSRPPPIGAIFFILHIPNFIIFTSRAYPETKPGLFLFIFFLFLLIQDSRAGYTYGETRLLVYNDHTGSISLLDTNLNTEQNILMYDIISLAGPDGWLGPVQVISDLHAYGPLGILAD